MGIVMVLICGIVCIMLFLCVANIIIFCINSNSKNSFILFDLTIIAISWIFLFAISSIQILILLSTSLERSFFIGFYTFLLIIFIIINYNILTICKSIVHFYLRLLYISFFSLLAIIMNISACIIAVIDNNMINIILSVSVIVVSILHIGIINKWRSLNGNLVIENGILGEF